MKSLQQRRKALLGMLEPCRKLLERAYAPYSGIQVAAVILWGDQKQASLGCNVENASYGLTICAERAAIVRAVADGMQPQEAWGLVLTARKQGKQLKIYPCGACLQVLQEFAAPEFLLLLDHPEPRFLSLRDLLPSPWECRLMDRRAEEAPRAESASGDRDPSSPP